MDDDRTVWSWRDDIYSVSLVIYCIFANTASPENPNLKLLPHGIA
jgi:hypothetical protein